MRRCGDRGINLTQTSTANDTELGRGGFMKFSPRRGFFREIFRARK